MPMRSSKLYAIYRVDHEAKRTHCWLVIVQRRRRIYHRHFSDGVHGGKRKALQAAICYQNALVSKLRGLTRREVCAIKKKNNRSGISGVTRIEVKAKGQGKHRAFGMCNGPLVKAKPATKNSL
jgi:hypothetical protein